MRGEICLVDRILDRSGDAGLILTSYATKGILTINEARIALGREPLTEAAANQAMVLIGRRCYKDALRLIRIESDGAREGS